MPLDMNEDQLRDVIRDAMERYVTEAPGALIGGVQNRVEMHLNVDDPAIGEAIANLLLSGTAAVTVHVKPGR